MKKISFMVLQVTLSAILIVMGILLSCKSAVNTQGSALAVMVVPGLDILLMPVWETLKLKKWWMYCAIYFILATVAGAVIILANHIQLDVLSILALVGIFVFTTAICFMFHLIYKSTKKPGRTR